MPAIRAASAVLALLATASVAAAHDTWLSPARAGGAGQPLRFHLTSGGAFPATEAARADESWREPVGLDLEIVPETSPASLAAGDTLSVRVLKKGAPLAGLPLRAARKGSAGTAQRTDHDGRASFRIDAARPWLVAGTDLRESAARPGEWESDFTTLTLEVGPARRN